MVVETESEFRHFAFSKTCCILIDHEGNKRVVQPYGVFINSNDIRCYCAYQLSGYSKSGGLPKWRNIPVIKIKGAIATKDHFNIQPDYDPENRQVYPMWEWHI